MAWPMTSSQCVSRRFDEAMVLVNAIARDRRRTGASPESSFSGFCNARQQPVIFAASVRLISLSPAARCACNAASTCCSDMASTTTL